MGRRATAGSNRTILNPSAPTARVDCSEPGMVRHPLLDRPPREVPRDEERGSRAEGCADEDVRRALHDAEHGAGRERQQRSRDEGHRRCHVAQDEDGRAPDAEAFDPTDERRQVTAELTTQRDEYHERRDPGRDAAPGAPGRLSRLRRNSSESFPFR